MHHKNFPNTVYDVVFSPGQFEVVANNMYYTTPLTSICIAAVNDAYYNYNESNKAMGALFFKSPASNADWSHREYLFIDSAGHSFYK